MRDGLSQYAEILMHEARAQYQHDVHTWAQLAPHHKQTPPMPTLPAILR